jgi:acyl-coenzyme A synthetase/AMP-(fatty) acid ligase
VDEAAALPVTDAAKGERVVAHVESSTLTAERLMQLCREQLSPREVPAEITVTRRLPRNARGKIDRAALPGEGR